MKQNWKCILCIGWLLAGGTVLAQYKVTLIINRLPAYHSTTDQIYLAGNFNNWNPKDALLLLKNIQGKSGITIEMKKGLMEYKFTKGGWDMVEAGKDGTVIQNRKADIKSDTTIMVDIEQWADHFPKKHKPSTASKNVQIIDAAFYIPQLKRNRRIWIYLPESYVSGKKHYPVMYMHDGQNIFDDATAAFGEWGVDEALDTLGPQYGELIVVGIDHAGSKRMNEYSPYDMPAHGAGEGGQYVDFLVKTLKPFIDQRYRTMKEASHTFIAGSSMGGLISFYALLKYPKVFGGAGVFSPAFWIAPPLKKINPDQAKKVKGKIYFYAGQQEGENMVPDMLTVFDQMRHYSKAKMEIVIRAEGKHNESTWKAEFPLFYKWMMRGEE